MYCIYTLCAVSNTVLWQICACVCVCKLRWNLLSKQDCVSGSVASIMLTLSVQVPEGLQYLFVCVCVFVGPWVYCLSQTLPVGDMPALCDIVTDFLPTQTLPWRYKCLHHVYAMVDCTVWERKGLWFCLWEDLIISAAVYQSYPRPGPSLWEDLV